MLTAFITIIRTLLSLEFVRLIDDSQNFFLFYRQKKKEDFLNIWKRLQKIKRIPIEHIGTRDPHPKENKKPTIIIYDDKTCFHIFLYTSTYHFSRKWFIKNGVNSFLSFKHKTFKEDDRKLILKLYLIASVAPMDPIKLDNGLGLGFGFWVALSKASRWEFCAGEAHKAGFTGISCSNPPPKTGFPPSDDTVLINLPPPLDFPFAADVTLTTLLFFLQPPPMGTLRRAPPLVQYRRHVLQKCRGWVRL